MTSLSAYLHGLYGCTEMTQRTVGADVQITKDQVLGDVQLYDDVSCWR